MLIVFHNNYKIRKYYVINLFYIRIIVRSTIEQSVMNNASKEV